MAETYGWKMSRGLVNVDFVCDRCKKSKKSKNIARKGGQQICNGCYGEILNKGGQF